MRQFLIAFLLVLGCAAFAQTPEDTVRAFVDAVNKKDIDSAANMIKGGQFPPEFKAELAKTKEWPSFSISDVKGTVTGQTASVTYQLHTSGITGTFPDHVETLNLVQSGSKWLIQAPAKAPDDNKEMMPSLVYFLAHPEIAGHAKDAAKATVCMSNLKQIALGFLMFASDYDDVFKLTATNWKSKIMPYIKNEAIFTCPDDPKGTLSYSFNGQLAGKNMAKVSDPSKLVLVYEGKGGTLNFRHDGKANVAFADGHVRRITKEEAKNLVWKA